MVSTETGLCAASLKKPVIFGNFNKKKICAVVVLGINNRKEDSDLLNLCLYSWERGKPKTPKRKRYHN
ncbi:MAG: hypothetical protein ACLR0U_00645 [Enterocloster clostridioformis]